MHIRFNFGISSSGTSSIFDIPFIVWEQNYRPQTRKDTWVTMSPKKPLTDEQKRKRKQWERIKSEAVDAIIVEEICNDSSKK